LSNAGFLFDVNVLVAFTDLNHIHHRLVREWFFQRGDASWGTCAITEAGFLRVTTREKTGGLTLAQASELLQQLAARPGYRNWPITESWALLTAPFAARIFGHQQITVAYLLGLVIKENGVLVTLDNAVNFIAGPQYRHNLLVLE